ncbi:MAG: tRNA (adenosine(37)-N6)-threonylcarbamoyltransferase complex dimerization subunit type 1 TsaB [Acidobacteria bacterium]|nr:tRNA (adenosine(37)-N6)-threonylcarbamoyltransferase complex dimerization subunit type 1 TsaB [Acidobacteriota bacterium]
MLVLALDTTSEHGGAAVYNGDVRLAMAANEGAADRYSVTLFESVERALAEAKLGFRDIELYAVAKGPGSFTGIRVGLAAAQAWAKGFGKPLHAVTLLEAMVQQAQPDTDWAVPILDARRGEFFLGFYRRSGGAGPSARFVAAGEGMVVRPEQLSNVVETLAQGGQCRTFSRGTIACLTRTHDLKAQALRENLSPTLTWISIPGVLLDAIAGVALHAYGQGEISRFEELDAYYIRRSDAEMNWRS